MAVAFDIGVYDPGVFDMSEYTYPIDFPLPLVEGFNFTVAAGVIRADMPTHQAQRRVFNTMPHTFNLAFIMSVSQWGPWQQWAVASGYNWFTIPLPSIYAGRVGLRSAAAKIRFTSDLAANNVSATDIQITVSAEFAPSMFTQWLDNT